jgi:predicted HTH transcriptional regulator
MRFNPEIKYDTDVLEQLISKGEGVQLDFKQSINNQKKIARTLAAFANNRGGKLLVGVQF